MTTDDTLLDWLKEHGLREITSHHMDIPISEIDGLDSILLVALVIEIEERTRKTLPKEIFLRIAQVSINELLTLASK